jgi:hypothetical protein
VGRGGVGGDQGEVFVAYTGFEFFEYEDVEVSIYDPQL